MTTKLSRIVSSLLFCVSLQSFAVTNPLTILGLTPDASVVDVFTAYASFESRYKLLQIQGLAEEYDAVVLEKANKAFEELDTEQELHHFVTRRIPEGPRQKEGRVWKVLDFVELSHFLNDRAHELNRGFLVPRHDVQNFLNQLSTLKFTFESLVKSQPELFVPPKSWYSLPENIPEKIDGVAFQVVKQLLEGGESIQFVKTLLKKSDLTISRRSVSFIGFILDQKVPSSYGDFENLSRFTSSFLNNSFAWSSYFTHKKDLFIEFAEKLEPFDLEKAIKSIHGRTNHLTLVEKALSQAQSADDFLRLLMLQPQPLSTSSVENRLANGIDLTEQEYAFKKKKLGLKLYPKFSGLNPSSEQIQKFAQSTGTTPLALKYEKAKSGCLNLLGFFTTHLFRR